VSHEVQHYDESQDISREVADHDIDVGQIAVDVLDLADEIIIVAPIAGVDPSDVDIALSRNILTLS
jgi:HSP20 family molecular chaperone IbpA